MSQCTNPDCPNCQYGSNGTYVPDGRDCDCPSCNQKRSCSKGQVDDGTECVKCSGSTSQSICTTCGTEWEYNSSGKCVPAGSGGGTPGGGTPPSKNVELTTQEIALDSVGILESFLGLITSGYLLMYTESGILIPGISGLSALVSISTGIAGLVIKDNDEILNSLSYVSASFGTISAGAGLFGFATTQRLRGSGVGTPVNLSRNNPPRGRSVEEADYARTTNPIHSTMPVEGETII